MTLTAAMPMKKIFSRSFSLTGTITPSISRLAKFFRPISASTTLTPTMTTSKIFFRTLAASSTVAPTLTRLPFVSNRALAAGATLAPTMVRKLSAFRLLAVGGAGSVASDDFNRANGALGPNWLTSAEGSNPAISGNKVISTSGICGATWAANTFGNDQFAQIDGISSFLGDASTVSGLMLRSQLAGATCYHARLFANNGSPVFQIYKRTSPASLSQLRSRNVTAPTPVSTDVLRFEAAGSTLTLKFNGATVITLTDTDISGGNPGIRINGNGSVDDFQCGDIRSYWIDFHSDAGCK